MINISVWMSTYRHDIYTYRCDSKMLVEIMGDHYFTKLHIWWQYGSYIKDGPWQIFNSAMS